MENKKNSGNWGTFSPESSMDISDKTNNKINRNIHKEIVIDATDGVLGRIASYAAKHSLFGKNVKIVNCNDAIITGDKKMILEKYKAARRRGGAAMNGPHFPKHPERIMKRTVRGMLSYTQGRGLEAFKRVMCYNEVPAELQGKDKITLKREIKVKAIKLSELCRWL